MNKYNSITKRILPLVLSATLCLGMVSGAFAADDPKEEKEPEIESTVEMTTEGSEDTDDSISAPEGKKTAPEWSDNESDEKTEKPIEETKESFTEESLVPEESKPKEEDLKSEEQPQGGLKASDDPKAEGEKTSDQEEEEKPEEHVSDKESGSDSKDNPEDRIKEDSSEEIKESKEDLEKTKSEEKAEVDEITEDKTEEEKETQKTFSELPKEMYISEATLAGVDFSSARLLVAGSIIDPENELSSYYRKGVFRHFTEDCTCSTSMTARIDVNVSAQMCASMIGNTEEVNNQHYTYDISHMDEKREAVKKAHAKRAYE